MTDTIGLPEHEVKVIAAMTKPKTMIAIANALNLPYAEAYKRVREWRILGVVKMIKTLSNKTLYVKI